VVPAASAKLLFVFFFSPLGLFTWVVFFRRNDTVSFSFERVFFSDDDSSLLLRTIAPLSSSLSLISILSIARCNDDELSLDPSFAFTDVFITLRLLRKRATKNDDFDDDDL
jgi:hypothetical protein